MEDSSKEFKDLILAEYESLLSSKHDYSQIRFIGIKNNGKEIIRVERAGDQIIKVQDKKLQEKGHRDYFFETIKLEKGSLYVSEINLNREHGKISKPNIPTLRVAYPVYHENKLKGIIVINTDLKFLFQSIQKTIHKSSMVRIVNNEGHYILHEDQEQSFGFEFNKHPTFKEDFGLNVSKIGILSEHSFSENGLIYASRKLYFPRSDYELHIIVLAHKTQLLQSYYTWRKNSILIVLVLGIAFMILSFLHMNRQFNELNKIINTLKSFPSTLQKSDLPTHRKDEIGELAKSFNQMSILVSDTIQSLEKERNKAEVAVKDKIEFMENMSHEIRNPLQSISGLCELLEKNEPQNHQIKIINSLKFNTSNLHNLVNDILDYKRIIRGDFKIKLEWTSLHKMIQEIHSSHNHFAILKKIHFNFIIDELLLNQEIFVDKTRISQILHNLIVNAIKYSDHGCKIVLSVQIQENNLLLFSVQDNGPGISKEGKEEFTSRYYIAKNTHSFNDSFGLGLNIVLQLLQQLDSSLKITDNHPSGSIFSFVLDLATREVKRESSKKFKHGNYPILKNKHILFIDDDDQILNLYQHIFKDKVAGFNSIDFPDKLTMADRQKYDIIIADLKFHQDTLMNFKNEILDIIRKDTIIYIVSATSIQTDEFSTSFPIKSVFQKPFNSEVLLKQIDSDLKELTYGKVNFDPIFRDYDYETEKVARALHLLFSEWKKMKKQLVETVKSNNYKDFSNVEHKMITSVRRLQLDKFEILLNEIDKSFKYNQSLNYLDSLSETMSYYLEEIKSEIDRIS